MKTNSLLNSLLTHLGFATAAVEPVPATPEAFVPQTPAIPPVKEVEERKPTFMDRLLGKQMFWQDLSRDERIAKAKAKRERKMKRNLELVRLGGLQAV